MPTDATDLEIFRPLFHFTAEKYWLNDPNGLVYYQDEYHLFFQRNSRSMLWGPTTWGHAVSSDLIHWKRLPNALEPDDEFGWIWSGSAVMDRTNSSGLRVGEEIPLVAIYTAGDPAAGKPCVQCIASSHDRGRTFIKYRDNPVIGHVVGENRDPKVVWHDASRRWIMALYLEETEYALFGSENLRDWSRLGSVILPGSGECPDFFELAIDDRPDVKKWVFWGAAGIYLVGDFDGENFIPETEPLRCELGPNGYAAQTWSDIPAADGRRIQISWMRGGRYPYMPFNQQMSFPVTLELRSFPEGLRLCRNPIKEIEILRESTLSWEDHALAPGSHLIPDTSGQAFDLRAVIDLGDAEAWGVRIHGTDLRYVVGESRFAYQSQEIQIDRPEGYLELRILVDRASLELFAQEGKFSASFCFLPKACDAPLEFYAINGSARLVTLKIHPLRSVWD